MPWELGHLMNSDSLLPTQAEPQYSLVEEWSTAESIEFVLFLHCFESKALLCLVLLKDPVVAISHHRQFHGKQVQMQNKN